MGNKAKHTPPPWKCDKRGIITDTRGRIIAEVGRVGTNADENVSNGFLIAAAPEMHALLSEFANMNHAWTRKLDSYQRARALVRQNEVPS